MKIQSEDELLDITIRKEIIIDIMAFENVERRKEHLKRREIYKDNTKKWVVDRLKKESLAADTVQMMENRCSNISICKKIVDKLARTYKGGVQRSTEDDDVTESINELARLLCLDQKQKKLDKYLELHKNTVSYIVPEEIEPGKFEIKFRVLAPWQYDVVENANDNEKPIAYILSDYTEQNDFARTEADKSDNIDNKIADAPSDAGMHHSDSGPRRTFIFWTNSYHFTCDEHGEIIEKKSSEERLSPEDRANPIKGFIPFVNYAEDQDGEFWAQGGEDLTEGSILINLLITDMLSIAYQQGYGLPVITGMKPGTSIEWGPNRALLLPYDKENDPKPEVQMLSANPPLDMWMRIIEQYVALLLSTNKLSSSSIAMKLGTAQFPSGIAMLIEMSEATDDIQDKQHMFKDNERAQFDIIFAWQNYLLDKSALTDRFTLVGKIPDNTDVTIKFNEVRPVISDKEKLELIEKRKDLGLNEEVDLIMIDDPDLTREEAEEKLLAITEEKLKKMSVFAIGKKDEDKDEDLDKDKSDDDDDDKKDE